jgi:cyclic-di-GMP-binding protein
MPSFDVVSKLDGHEVTNAVDQANREVGQRFDLKDTGARFELTDFVVTARAPSDFQLRQLLEILKIKLAKRGIDVACLEVKEPSVNLAEAKQEIVLRHGIDQDSGRKLVKLIKESRLKVQAGIHGDKLRVTGKQRDELQAAIALLRKEPFDRPLQYENFRD